MELDFFSFLKYGLPVALILLPTCWALLVFVFHREKLELGADGIEVLNQRRISLGRLEGGERVVMLLFATVALGWFFREPKDIGSLHIFGLTSIVPNLTDAGIAITGAIMLFFVPGRSASAPTRPLLTWREAREIPWDVLLLFGGGLSLAAAIESSGLAARIGVWMAGLQGLPDRKSVV